MMPQSLRQRSKRQDQNYLAALEGCNDLLRKTVRLQEAHMSLLKADSCYQEGRRLIQEQKDDESVEYGRSLIRKAALRKHSAARHYLFENSTIPTDEVIVYDEERENLLGIGSFGEVYKGIYEGQDVAVKRLKADLDLHSTQEELDRFKHELVLMVALEHPSLVSVYGHTKLPLQLIMTFCRHGSLYNFLQSVSKETLTWDIRVKIATQLADGLAYLHENGIVHQDIKSENVLIDDEMNAKWADFGLARLKKSPIQKTTLQQASNSYTIPAGTRRWMAPEQLRGLVPVKECSRKSDIYSFALVMWELASHQIPFPGMADHVMVNYIVSGGKNKIPQGTDERFSKAIHVGTLFNPTKRPSAKEISKYLKGEDNELFNQREDTGVPEQGKNCCIFC